MVDIFHYPFPLYRLFFCPANRVWGHTVTPPSHEHSYGDWHKDGTSHWHECTDDDCPNRDESIKDKAAHVYDDDTDTTCNVCGYERTVPFPVSWTVKMKKKQKETQDILSYHTQAAGCSDKARAKASGGRQPIEECGRTGL